MIPAAFDYVAPSTVGEAIRALSDAGEDAKVLAGGQSMLPVLRLRLASPPVIIDLGRVAVSAAARAAAEQCLDPRHLRRDHRAVRRRR